jgi:Gram-negative bacterial TonB protein C-terminal
VKLLKCSLLLVALASVPRHVLAQSTAPSSQRQMRGEAVLVSLSRPSFPPLARVANISGRVKVLVTVRPDGTTEVAILEGHPMLRDAALESAKSSHFECNGCDAPAMYSITYAFERTEKGTCCDGAGAPVEVTQEPERTDEQGIRQAKIVISTEHFCLCDPPATISTTRVRSWKCFYIWKCASRQ